VPDHGPFAPHRDARRGRPAICPSCATQGHGGFVSFVGDLRMAYACPACLCLIWVQGA
jgi:hypothetical protein